MKNAWFILYHKYSRKSYFDAEGVGAFRRDAEWAAANGIELLIIEDYFVNYPEYLHFWSAENMRAMLDIAHDLGIKVLPYTSPSTMDASSIFYRLNGDEWTTKVRSQLGGTVIKWAGFRSEVGGGRYWHDYRGETLNWVATCASTTWRDHYLAMVRGLLAFGFDGIYIDQHQEGTECVDHPDVNEKALEMLAEMRALVKADSPDNLICANIMSGPPSAHHPQFVERTKVADIGLTESANQDIQASIEAWVEATGLDFLVFSHGTYESHKTKLDQARAMNQPLCLFSADRLSDTDPRILDLYARDN